VRSRTQVARWLLVIAALSVTAVAAALVSQHVFDMPPCPWCVLQRAIYLTIAAVCLIGATLALPLARRAAGALALLLALSGAASALYQHLVAARSASCNLTFADKVMSALGLDSILPWLFQVYASCADAAVSMLGVPYAYWSLALFAALGLGAARVAFGRT
jgi:disulfide bond formation protein DsbB